jgi:hypothetical protein
MPRPTTCERGCVGASIAILTPTGSTGAIAIIQLAAAHGDELDSLLGSLGIGPLPIGAAALRDLLGADRGIAARWSATICHLMPHGGAGVVRTLLTRLRDAGVQAAAAPGRPEARTAIEGHVLSALAMATSPLAIDVLLDQPRRWATGMESDPALDLVLSRLMEPPLVVALGPANVGKSTLVNALAGRSVAIVADEAGTTRDHVGVMVDLAGLVVRYLDTPGLRETSDSIEREAQALSLRAAAQADLVLLVGDAGSPLPSPPLSVPILRVALRTDLGPAAWPADFRVCAPTGIGLPELVAGIREALVPSAALEDARPWRFWQEPAAPTTGATGPE